MRSVVRYAYFDCHMAHNSFYSVKVHYYDIQNRLHGEATPLLTSSSRPLFA